MLPGSVFEIIRLIITMPTDANFITSSATVQYSFRLFLQLFSTARSNSDVLHDLSQFPIDLFITHMFDGFFPVFSFIPLLFDWIKNEV